MTETIEEIQVKPKVKDRYDRAIDYLNEHWDEMYGASQVSDGVYQVFAAWNYQSHPAHCLFQRASKSGGGGCCCLTQIRNKEGWGETLEVTRHVLDNLSIPDSPYDICPQHLHVFAQEQRWIDEELGRVWND